MILARLLPCAFAVLLVAQLPLNVTAQDHAAQDHEIKDNPTVHELTLDTVITRVKYAPDKPPLELTLQQFMKKYNIPGISVAVIDNYKLVWAKGFGVAAAGGTEPVTPTTLFQAGSISKPVATAGALWLVEHGKLSLDEDVNKKLKTWKVPENQFTATEKVTLRRLMTHTAGLTVHGFPGYAVGEPLPTLVQIFNGEKPANTEAIRVDFVPGSKRRYSGGGVTIEQQLMMDVTGQPFPELMQKTVLSKIGMSNSTYEQPLPPGRAAQAASGSRADNLPIPGKWHIYPEMAAAGLWTTPIDLAKFAIEIALSKKGKANHVLSQKMTEEMLTPQPPHNESDGAVGLGFFLDDKNSDEFGHDGADDGFQAFLMMLADSGKGLVIMGNSDSFFYITPRILGVVSREYGWKYTPPPEPGSNVLMLIENMVSPQGALDFYQQVKSSGNQEYKMDESSLNSLGYHLLMQKKTDLAIKVFERNVQEYPNAWNPYDSLAEAYAAAGQRELAIKNYEKSLALNPDNKSGAEHLKKLKAEK